MVCADEHVADVPCAVDNETDLPVDPGRGFRERAGRLGGNDRIGRHPSAVETLEHLYRGGLETGYVAVDGGDEQLLP